MASKKTLQPNLDTARRRIAAGTRDVTARVAQLLALASDDAGGPDPEAALPQLEQAQALLAAFVGQARTGLAGTLKAQADVLHHLADLIELNVERGTLDRATDHLVDGIAELQPTLDLLRPELEGMAAT